MPMLFLTSNNHVNRAKEQVMKNRVVSTLLLITSFLLSILLVPTAAALTSDEKSALQDIRNNMFGGTRLNAAFEQSTISGEGPPVFSYNLTDRALLVWRIDRGELDSFAQAIALPADLELTPVAPLVEDATEEDLSQWLSFAGISWVEDLLTGQYYYLIADIANTSGAEQGLKLEWKTFVKSEDSDPFLYRFDVQKQIPGNDLIDVSVTSPAQMSWTNTGSQMTGSVDFQGQSLQVSIPFRLDISQQPRVNAVDQFTEEYLNASERILSATGASSRYYYDGSSVSTHFYKIKSTRVSISNSFAWAEYVSSFDGALVPTEVMAFLVQPVTVPVLPSPEGQFGASELFGQLVGMVLSGATPDSVFATLFGAGLPPTQQATLYYAVMDLYQGLQIYAGLEKPKMFFSLLDEPKTIFVNFEIPADKVEAFKAEFLPEHFELAKLRFYPEQDRALYAVSLNIYRSVGQNIGGFRAEWSAYVINPLEDNPKPRFNVLEAQTTVGGFDPVIALERYVPGMDLTDPNQLMSLIEPPSDLFEYSFDEDNGIQVRIQDAAEGIDVDIDIAYPRSYRQLYTKADKTWMEGNDFVYWNEVADNVRYDRQVMFADIMVFNTLPGDLVVDSVFEGYVDPDPLPIIVWLGGQDIAVEPWANLDDIVVED